jgi:hypothetical protein
MSTFYIMLLLIGSVAVSKNIRELVISVKKRNKERIKVSIFFLLLILTVITLLIVFERSKQ